MMWRWLRCLVCRHEFHLRSDHVGQPRTGRLFEQCIWCKKERPGWTIDLALTTKLEKKRLTADQQNKLLGMKRRWRRA